MSEVKIDLNNLVTMRLFTMNKNKELIEKNWDKLYKITQDYLKILNTNSKFLDKPAIVERVKYIIFNNLLLSENVQFKNNGIIAESSDKETQKILYVLKNGSIIFYQENKGEKLVVSFDELEEGLACRFLEYSKGEILKSEKRVIIDKYGFDKSFYEIGNIPTYKDVNEKLREKFKHIITYLNEREIIAFTDWGNHSITPLLDNKFLCAKNAKKIVLEELYEENRCESINFDNPTDWLVAFPYDIPEMSEFSVLKVQDSYSYYTDRYPLAKAWFINRYGKQFLIDKKIISKEDTFKEDSLIQKLSDATQEEVMMSFQKRIDMDKDTIIDIIEKLYSKEMYGKAAVFFDKLPDQEKILFIENNDEFELDFISLCIARIEDDTKKKEQYKEFFNQISINNKIAIISSFNDEEEKIDLYNEILDEIIEYDTDQEKNISNEEDNFVEIIYLSEAVLDSLKDTENIKEFILKFSSFPIIKYEHINDMDKEDIDYLLENLEGELDDVENLAFLKTNYVDDDYIIELLESNWDEGLELSSDEPVDLEDDLGYSFKVYALTKVIDEEKRFKFLDEYKEDFSPEEISMLLEDMKDSIKMLELAKKYDLPQDYICGLVTLCDDDLKISFLNSQDVIENENFIRIASTISDVSKAFEFVIQTDKIDIITKLETINELYIELADEEEVSYLSESKFQFLMENSKKISAAVKSKGDIEILNLYISEFWGDDEKMAKIEKPFKNIIEEECK